MPSIKKILAPIDFSEVSNRSLDYAVDLAAQIKAAVLVVHVYEIPVYGFPEGAIITPPDVAADLADRAQKSLDAAVTTRRNRGVEITGTLTNGSPREEILRLAQEGHADLIVMGTHGRRGLPRALLGSVAERVVRTSEIPVLTIRGPQES
jgi:nucleotide-binding universal stress UspA family protein